MGDDTFFDKEADTASKKRKADGVQSNNDIRWLMSDPRGRRIAIDLLEQAGVLRSTFTGEALSGAFNEGKRSLGTRFISKILELCPEDFVLMLKEFNKDE